MRRGRWLSILVVLHHRRHPRRRRDIASARSQPRHVDRRLLHVLPQHGASWRPTRISCIPRIAATAPAYTPSCADCHIPKTNWFVETYAHAASGAARRRSPKKTHNYSDPAIWDTRRVELAHEVRDVMRAQDSVTCRSCHDAAAIQPDERARTGGACAAARRPHDLHRLPFQSRARAGAADHRIHPRVRASAARRNERRGGCDAQPDRHFEADGGRSRERRPCGGDHLGVERAARADAGTGSGGPRRTASRTARPGARHAGTATRHDRDDRGSVLCRMGKLAACQPQAPSRSIIGTRKAPFRSNARAAIRRPASATISAPTASTPVKVDHPAPVGTVITCVACHNDKTRALTDRDLCLRLDGATTRAPMRAA